MRYMVSVIYYSTPGRHWSEKKTKLYGPFEENIANELRNSLIANEYVSYVETLPENDVNEIARQICDEISGE